MTCIAGVRSACTHAICPVSSIAGSGDGSTERGYFQLYLVDSISKRARGETRAAEKKESRSRPLVFVSRTAVCCVRGMMMGKLGRSGDVDART